MAAIDFVLLAEIYQTIIKVRITLTNVLLYVINLENS